MTTVMDKLEIYSDLAKDALSKTRSFIIGELTLEQENHVINIAKSVMSTRDKVMVGGSFVQAIVDNDLYNAISRADVTCSRAIKFFVYCNRNIFPNQF